MRYRGGGVGHRIIWPLKDIMCAVGHTRPRHQTGGTRKGKERMEEERKEEGCAEEPQGLDGYDEEDVTDQVIAYDDDITQDDPEAAQALADEEEDYGYGDHGDDLVDPDEEEEEVFDVFEF